MPRKRKKGPSTTKKAKENIFLTFLRNTPSLLNTTILFIGIVGTYVAVAYATMSLYSVFLSESALPEILEPVARYVADIDFETRTVSFDTTFSKTTSSDPKITIWRFGDGRVVKSDMRSDIKDNEVLEYTFGKPGIYTIGYSIIDNNDLSDEALCTISFADRIESTTDYVSSTCGKSSTSYNSASSTFDSSTYDLNYPRYRMREAFGVLGLSVVILLGSVLFNKLFKKLYMEMAD